MNEEKPVVKTLIRYGVCTVVGLALMLIVLLINKYWMTEDAQEKLRILCDAFCIPGLLLMLSTGLVFARNEGAFNGVMYSLRTVKEMLLPFLPHQHMNYREYVQKKAEKKTKGYSFLLITGAVFLAVGIVLLIMYHTKYPG